MRGLLLLVLVASALSACGGSGSSALTTVPAATTTTESSAPDAGAATATTVAGRTTRFTLLIGAVVGGTPVQSSETGTIDFTEPLAHLYKLLPGGGQPQEIIVDGPFTYTNANVQAALQDPSVKPWTKLDTRRLTAKQRNAHPDELAHIRVLVHLPDGIAHARRLDSTTVASQRVTRFFGEVVPSRVVGAARASERSSIARALRNDYPAKPFFATFWLDDSGRVRRVLVNYKTAGGTPITLDGRFSQFGTKIDTKLPPARSIADITP